MINALYIFLGCGLGGLCRYWLCNMMNVIAGGRHYPYGTLLVNVSGSFLMGLLFVILVERLNGNGNAAAWRALWLVGFLGGYTTFSSFSIETLNLIENGDFGVAISNVLLSVLLCLIAVWAGVAIGRQQTVSLVSVDDMRQEVVND